MKNNYFKFATLLCAVAVALLGGSVLFSCSEDDETGVDESDFSASQFETLASRRITRSAEGQIDRPLIKVRSFKIHSEEKLLCTGVKVRVTAECDGSDDADIARVHFSAEVVYQDSTKVLTVAPLKCSKDAQKASVGHEDMNFTANVVFTNGDEGEKSVNVSFDWSQYLSSGDIQHFSTVINQSRNSVKI